MLERLRDAANSHDAARFAALFAEDYESVQPLHPSRSFRGSAQVLSNWTSVFEGVPDFTSEVLSSVVDGQNHFTLVVVTTVPCQKDHVLVAQQIHVLPHCRQLERASDLGLVGVCQIDRLQTPQLVEEVKGLSPDFPDVGLHHFARLLGRRRRSIANVHIP